MLSKGCKPDNFEPHNSLKLSSTDIRGLCSNFDECESFLESNSPDIVAQCETNLEFCRFDSNDGMCYKCHRISLTCSRLCIDFPNWIKNKKAMIKSKIMLINVFNTQ